MGQWYTVTIEEFSFGDTKCTISDVKAMTNGGQEDNYEFWEILPVVGLTDSTEALIIAQQEQELSTRSTVRSTVDLVHTVKRSLRDMFRNICAKYRLHPSKIHTNHRC